MKVTAGIDVGKDHLDAHQGNPTLEQDPPVV